jgi:hypothetical protein
MTDQPIDVPTNDDSLRTPRRRQASADALTGREAAKLVRELNRQLGLWQGTSVKLQIMCQRIAETRCPDPNVVEQCLQLFHAVSAEARQFDATIGRQSEKVARHGRINDTRRSFSMILERLRTCFGLLGIEPEEE